MSVYYCHSCDNLIDNDEIPCIEDPKSPKDQFWLMCETHERDTPEENRKAENEVREFSGKQLAIIEELRKDSPDDDSQHG